MYKENPVAYNVAAFLLYNDIEVITVFREVKLPDGYSKGFIFNIATGRQVDLYAEWSGLKRKKWFIFKEPDWSLKNRILKAELEKQGLLQSR